MIDDNGIKIIKPINFFKSEEDLKNKMKEFQETLDNSMKDIPIILRASEPPKNTKNTTRKIRKNT